MKKIVLLFTSLLCIAFCNKLFAENKKTKQFKVKALYLSPVTVSDSTRLQHYIYLAEHSEINTYVIDVKGEDGFVKYESNVPAVRTAKAWMAKVDMNKVVRTFHAHHIRVIGRIACFYDPYLAIEKPEWAIKDAHGKIYNIDINEPWLNPVNKEVWKYLVDIAKESLTKGVDEIQFDYVRFPFDGSKTELDFGEKIKERYKVIDDFLAYARKEMSNTILSADVFGIICESVNDPENIGQNLEYVGKNLDYISPMIYPALYANGQIVNDVPFAKPDLDPYGVVYNTLLNAKRRIAKVTGYRAKIRPYLQAFTGSWLSKGDYQTYCAEQILKQIKAAKDAGCDQWIFWNEENNYPEDGFLIKK